MFYTQLRPIMTTLPGNGYQNTDLWARMRKVAEERANRAALAAPHKATLQRLVNEHAGCQGRYNQKDTQAKKEAEAALVLIARGVKPGEKDPNVVALSEASAAARASSISANAEHHTLLTWHRRGGAVSTASPTAHAGAADSGSAARPSGCGSGAAAGGATRCRRRARCLQRP